jgi:adenylate cyclase
MKYLRSIGLVLIVALVLLCVRSADSKYVKILRYKVWDAYQTILPRQDVSNMVAVVNITEEDIKKYGQWPWPRHIVAMLIAKIADNGSAVINMNILFSEPDRMGGTEYLKSMPMPNNVREQLSKTLVDTDAVLGIIVKETNVILMQSIKNTTDKNYPSTIQIIEKGVVKPWLWNYPGIVSPIGKVSAGAAGVGVNVTAPEPDGVVRKVPMLIVIDDKKIYPSMILENIRVVNKSKRIKVIAGPYGIEEILVKKKVGVPVNYNAEMYIHYADPEQYVYVSAGEILGDKVNENKIKNRIIVIGLDAAGLSYLKDTPFQLMTDQQITAQALDTLLTESYLLRPAGMDQKEIWMMGLLGLLLILILPKTGILWSVPLLFLSTGSVIAASWFGYATRGWLIDASFPVIFLSIIWSHSVYNNFVTQFRLRQQIKKQFEHYLDPRMVKKLQKDPTLLKLGGETRTMTFMFSDIRGFTPISEKYKSNPEGLTKLINRFLTRMTNIIIKNGGTVDKFMGDCIMAFWNAPLETKDHQMLAVMTASQMQTELAKLNEELSAEGLPNINIGIGINTGEALVGNMGSDQRFDYSVIGDPVNLASRLESSSKTLGKTLIISENTMESIEDIFPFEYIDSITVKGKTEPIKVYTVIR